MKYERGCPSPPKHKIRVHKKSLDKRLQKLNKIRKAQIPRVFI